MIPKLSAPLTKAIRTSEGIAVWAFNLALVVGSSVPAAHLSVKDAAILAAVNNGLHVVARTALKAHLGTAVSAAGFSPLTPTALGKLPSDKVGEAVGQGIYDVAQDTAAMPTLAEVGDQVATLATDTEEIANPAPESLPSPVS